MGAEVFQADLVRTGADGRLAVMFKDESRVSLGPNSELALTAFAFSPSDGRLALGLRLARGEVIALAADPESGTGGRSHGHHRPGRGRSEPGE